MFLDPGFSDGSHPPLCSGKAQWLDKFDSVHCEITSAPIVGHDLFCIGCCQESLIKPARKCMAVDGAPVAPVDVATYFVEGGCFLVDYCWEELIPMALSN